MKVVLPISHDRVAPLLDTAREFAIITANTPEDIAKTTVVLTERDPVSKASRIASLGASVLICGALSWPMEALLNSLGIRVIPNTCGWLDEVVTAFLAGGLDEYSFLLPGCPPRHQRQRRRCRGRGRRQFPRR